MNKFKLPYYAVIFTSELHEEVEGYRDEAGRILELAKQQEGFLGFESARSEIGISVSYWKDMDSINQWRNNLTHIQAKEKGKQAWYKHYRTRICRVEKEY